MSLYKEALNRSKPRAHKPVPSSHLSDTDSLFVRASNNLPFQNGLEEYYSSYRAFQFLKDNHQLILFGLCIYASFIPSDILLYNGISFYPIVSRLALICLIVVIYCKVLTDAKYQWLPYIGLLLCSLGALQAFTGAIILDYPHNKLFFIGVVMFLVFGVCLFRFCFKLLFFLITLIISLYVFGLWFFVDKFSGFAINQVFHQFEILIFILVLVISAVGLYTAWLVEQLHRKEWLRNQIALKEKQKLDDLVELLDRRSMTDSLTRVYNRRFFDTTMSHVWDWHAKDNKEMSIIMIDFDWFKKFNDNYGHQKGDECLKKITKILADEVTQENKLATEEESQGFIARYGGEEFIILMSDTLHEYAYQFAKNLHKKVYDYGMKHEFSPLGVCTVSMGVATVKVKDTGTKDVAMAQLIKQADDALYKAKEQGKNQVVSMLEL